MGHSTTGAALRADASVTHSFTKPKGKKRETLTLKKPIKTRNKQGHFESSLDFSRKKEARGKAVDLDASFDAIPVLTAAVTPTAAGVVMDGVALDEIPVLENPVSISSKASRKTNPFLLATALLLSLALAVMLFGESTQHETNFEPPGFPVDQVASVEKNQFKNISSTTTNSAEDTADTSINVNDSNLLLVQNIVGMLSNEQFSKDTTIEAFLSVWSDLNAATKATLNGTPWFLRFIFSLQKQSKTYLQSPDSYDKNYNIKLNGLLKIAIAVGVMDQRGIQSSVEIYSSKQNELVETLKSEIALIENSTKKQKPSNESIARLSENFRKRYAAKVRKNVQIAPQTKSNKIIRNVAASNDTTPIRKLKSMVPANDATASPVELDTLVTRFVTAYEHGDLKMLVSLFSPTAKTNDKNSIAGIREDYKELFELSSFRILNLMNLRWSPSHNSMKGIGDYEIQIAMDEAGNARTLHGKIQFVVGKVDNQLRITRLYHLER